MSGLKEKQSAELMNYWQTCLHKVKIKSPQSGDSLDMCQCNVFIRKCNKASKLKTPSWQRPILPTPTISAFSMMFFAVLTMASMKQFDWGYLGLECCTWNLYWTANALNSSDANWVPWSVYTTAGIPYSANIVLRRLITGPDVWLDSFFTIGNLLK